MERLDVYLVNNYYFKSRSKSQEEIKNGNVLVNGKVINKPSYLVSDNDTIDISDGVLKYVSRGGLKLEKAINEFNIDLNNKILVDIGSSTGGFTDCALMNGVSKVYCVDVGTDQLDSKLRNDSRVVVYENTDFRNIDSNIIDDANIVSIDVSFISVTKLIDSISKLNNVNEIICLVKPQFECGKEIADKYKGIPLNKDVHKEVIRNLIISFKDYGYYTCGLTVSPIKGGNGNIEYLLYLKNEIGHNIIKVDDVVYTAFKNNLKKI